eukprot:s147_g23.t1
MWFHPRLEKDMVGDFRPLRPAIAAGLKCPVMVHGKDLGDGPETVGHMGDRIVSFIFETRSPCAADGWPLSRGAMVLRSPTFLVGRGPMGPSLGYLFFWVMKCGWL